MLVLVSISLVFNQGVVNKFPGESKLLRALQHRKFDQ